MGSCAPYGAAQPAYARPGDRPGQGNRPAALLSMVIASIPFTAAMLPVIGYLTVTVPGAGSKGLFCCLSVGSAVGGNGSLIGASANTVAAGIAERAGYPITYRHFLTRGFPALLITVGLASIWLVVRFVVLHNTGQQQGGERRAHVGARAQPHPLCSQGCASGQRDGDARHRTGAGKSRRV